MSEAKGGNHFKFAKKFAPRFQQPRVEARMRDQRQLTLEIGARGDIPHFPAATPQRYPVNMMGPIESGGTHGFR